jgi:hypothetical protein
LEIVTNISQIIFSFYCSSLIYRWSIRPFYFLKRRSVRVVLHAVLTLAIFVGVSLALSDLLTALIGALARAQSH